MAVAVTPLGANTVDGAFGGASPWAAGTGVTLGTGDVVIFAYSDAAIGALVKGVTAGGVVATPLGTTASSLGNAWIATGVNTATGNVSVATSSSVAYNLVGANWFLITGEGTPAFTSASFQGFSASSSPSVTGTVPSGGVGLVSLGCTVGSGSSNRNPTTWLNCVSSVNSTEESFVATGNTINVAGNYTTTTGTVSPNAQSTSQGYQNTNTDLMMLTFPAAGGGGGVVAVPGGNMPMMGVG